jgi:hypothetical protein
MALAAVILIQLICCAESLISKEEKRRVSHEIKK